MAHSPGQREPIFNAPRSIIILLGIFIAVHVLRGFVSPQSDVWWTFALAFVPARYSGMVDQLPGGSLTAFTSWVTHAFVHGDILHLLINSAWMLAFGSAMVRRFGITRFLGFAAVCTIAGAAAFLLGNWGQLVPMVGASGAIAGLMGGTMRFLFSAMTGPRPRDLHDNIRAVPRMSLGEALTDRRIVLATGGWVLINLAFGYGASALTSAGGIAWEAHLGGYFAGLLLFGLFDPGRSAPYDRFDGLPGDDDLRGGGGNPSDDRI